MVNVDFDALVDRFLEERDEQRTPQVGVYYPSGLTACLRQQYYGYLTPKPADKDTRRIFHAGNLVHDFVADVLKNSGLGAHEAEKSVRLVSLEDDFVVAGRLDNFIRTRGGVDDILVEVKSIKNFSFLDAPKEEHVLQVQPYMKATGVKYCWIVYVDKTTLAVRSFRVDYSPALLKKLFERARLLHGFLVRGELPPAEALENASMSWACAYCKYRRECENGLKPRFSGLDEGGV